MEVCPEKKSLLALRLEFGLSSLCLSSLSSLSVSSPFLPSPSTPAAISARPSSVSLAVIGKVAFICFFICDWDNGAASFCADRAGRAVTLFHLC